VLTTKATNTAAKAANVTTKPANVTANPANVTSKPASAVSGRQRCWGERNAQSDRRHRNDIPKPFHVLCL
jgi:hypothetical protein